ncbi:polysaccharide deacetylase family protein [Bacillus sp. PS06]|uniref:polysaccharide deacetylase family protein n=1 Tax=Bacillus sp. PS06 TaxID=2764176 RepID=UPI00177F0FC4|nr:polysaccharide deacetylase family protein [Bacillus sp. PS06]MBD8067878.1 polysaccharide deacetylase family protein [Bacillus sp. PS06]
MKKKYLAIGFVLFMLILLLFCTYKLMNARTFQLFGGLTYQVETDEKVVALTFDDGPTKQTDEILDMLAHYKIKATFFLIGSDIEENPEEVKQIVQAGHQVGNHTYSHERMIFKSLEFIDTEITKTDQLIKDAGYMNEIVFRPPNGKKLFGLPYYLSKQEKETIMWNLEPDSYFSSSSEMVQYVSDQITPGSIILMHPMYDQTGEELEAIKGIIETLLNEGYSFVTVDELKKLAAKD